MAILRSGTLTVGQSGSPGEKTLLSQSDFTYLGSFTPPLGREYISTGRVTGTRIDAETIVLAADEPGITSPNVMFQITDGPYTGQSWKFFNWNSGTLRGKMFPGNLPNITPGTGYRTYYEYTSYNGANSSRGGLGVRRVGGQVRLSMISGHGDAGQKSGNLYEFLPPETLSKDSSDIPVGEFVQSWPDAGKDGAYQNSDVNGNLYINANWGGDDKPQGVVWDGDDAYVFYGGDYQIAANCPSFMKLHLEEDNTFTRYGPYRMVGVGYKRAMGGLSVVPQAFADNHLDAGGQKRLAVFGGGYRSLFAQRGGAGGTCINVIEVPPNVTYDYTGPDDGSQIPYLPKTELISYDASGIGSSRRPPGYINRTYTQRFSDGACRGGSANTILMWWYNATTYDASVPTGMKIEITSGTCTGDVRTVQSFNGITSTVTVTSDWSQSSGPANGDTYLLYQGQFVAASINQVTLESSSPGGWIKVVSGDAIGEDERTLTLVSGNTYTVSPSFETTPAIGDKYRFYGTGYSGVPDANENYGHWNWGDSLGQAHVWIDGTAKHGILSFPSLTAEHAWYERSALRARGFKSWWFLYDPDYLATVADGTNSSTDVVPTWWEPTYDELGDTKTGYLAQPNPTTPMPEFTFSNGVQCDVQGAAYDPVDKKLYLNVYTYPNVYNVHVYDVNC